MFGKEMIRKGLAGLALVVASSTIYNCNEPEGDMFKHEPTIYHVTGGPEETADFCEELGYKALTWSVDGTTCSDGSFVIPYAKEND